jgi:S1-C subfamily serine protease
MDNPTDLLKFFRAGSNEHFEIRFNEGDFPSLKFPHPSQSFVMAVVHHSDKVVHGLGTCFSISSHGLVVTARHVVEEVARILAEASDTSDEFCGILCICPETKPDSSTKYVGGVLPIANVWTNNFLDIALMLVELPRHNETNELLPLGMLALSPGIPDIGNSCIGMGYSSVEWKVHQANLPEISHSYHATRGTIEENHFPGRDQRLNFPCFLTNARFDLGMSGGPIVSATGQVCGVICSGTEMADPAIPMISYGSLIGPALAIPIKMKGSDGVTKSFFLWDLVRGGAVFCDSTCKQIKVKRNDNSIEIDFGNDRIIRNRLI